MKLNLLYFLLLVFLSSCQTYQYLSLSGTNIAQDSHNQFVAENDTLLLQYNFYGHNGPVKITVYNKTATPIYIDWKKSAIIIGDMAYSYYSPTQQLSGTTSSTSTLGTIGYRYGYSNLHSTSGTIEATIKGQEGIEFIPPNSMKEQSTLYLINGYLKNIPEESMTTRNLWPETKGFPKMKSIDFTVANSPIQLRSYLTFSTNGKEFSMEHQFYVSQIFQGMITPSALTPVRGKGNYFYSSKSNGVGVAVGVSLLVVVLALGSNADSGIK